MTKKVWPVLLAVVLVFGLALLGCGSKNDDTGGGVFVPLNFTGPWAGVIEGWGTSAPTITDNEISITASTSTGFYISFDKIGYTLNRSDVFIFTYEIEVETPVAVLTVKSMSGGNLSDVSSAGGTGWGKGNGWEYALGSDTLSVYEGPKVASTWDGTTGTFEVLMNLFPASAKGIGFQHNAWCDMGGGGTIAEHSEYKLKITKIENKAGNAPPPPPPPTGTDFFDDAVGLKEGITVYGGGAHEFDEDTGILTVSGNGGFAVPLPAGFTVADTVSIQYACIDASEEPSDIKFIKKQDSGWTDVGDENKYPTFNTTEVSTITVTGFNAAGVAAGKAFFQTNGESFTAKIKIISITRIEGAPIKVTAAVTGLKPVLGETAKATVETDQFTGTVTWDPAVSGAFAGDVYTATIALTAKTGYTFNGVEADAIDVVGADTVTHDAGTSGTLSITAVFPTAAVAAPDKSITFTADDLDAVDGFNVDVTAVSDTSFTVKTTAGYGWAYGFIEVDFGVFTLGDYSYLDFTFTGVEGDVGWKSARVWIFDEEPTGDQDQGNAVTTDGNNNDGSTGKSVTISLDKFSAIAGSNTVYVAFNLWSNSGTEFMISDIKFHNTAPVDE